MTPAPCPRSQRGLTLVEALVGFLVLSLGFLGTTRLQSSLRLHADISRQRSEAIALAQHQIEGLRATPSAQAYADLADLQATSTGTNTDFQLSQQVRGEAGWKSATLTVRWADRGGARHAVSFDTGIAGTAPVYSALLTLAPQDRSIAPPARQPWGTRPFSEGQSIFKPKADGTRVWLFNAGTGEVSAICSVPPGAALDALADGDLSACEAVQGTLLGGFIRFSGSAPPEAGHPRDTPLPLAVVLSLTPSLATAPRCETDAHPNGGEPFTSYACVVPIPAARGGWSGRLDIAPEGWALGHEATDHKVCRYSDDHDGSGRIDRNDEHPAAYTGVTGPLLQQNYLVVRGDQSCPASLQTHNAASPATVQHQP
jgi:Tfp pilus assembly protein PilV